MNYLIDRYLLPIIQSINSASTSHPSAPRPNGDKETPAEPITMLQDWRQRPASQWGQSVEASRCNIKNCQLCYSAPRPKGEQPKRKQ